MPASITNNDLVLLILTPDGVDAPFRNSYHVAELVRVLNSKRVTCGLDRLNLNGVTAVFKNDTDYSGGPGGGPADSAEDVDYNVSPVDENAFPAYLEAMHLAIEETANAVLISDGYPYRWRTLGTPTTPYEYPATWQTQSYSFDAAKEPANWQRFFVAMRDTINSLILMEAQTVYVTFAGPFTRLIDNGAFQSINVPSKLFHEVAELVISGAPMRTVRGGINFVLKGIGPFGRLNYYPTSPEPDNWQLLYNVFEKRHSAVFFDYQWVDGVQILVGTNFSVNSYNGLTAENFFDVVEEIEAWNINNGTDDPDSEEAMGSVFITIPAFAPLRTHILDTDYPDTDEWHTSAPRPTCAPKATYTVVVHNAAGLNVRLKIPYFAASKCFDAIGEWEARPPYSVKVELWDGTTATTMTISPSSDDWIYGDQGEYDTPPFYRDKRAWKLSGFWEPVVVPATDTEYYEFTQEILSANVPVYIESQLLNHSDGFVNRKFKTIEGVVSRSDVGQLRVIDPELASQPEYSNGYYSGVPRWGGRIYRNVSQSSPVPGRALQTVEVVTVTGPSKAVHTRTSSDKIIALEMVASAGIPQFKEIVP